MSHAFGFDDVARRAAVLAGEPYHEPTPDAAATGMDYDTRRSIRFRTERSQWRDAQLPFELQFFPRAAGSDGGEWRPVELYEIDGTLIRPIELPPEAFTAPGTRAAAPGAAGWRAHYPLNNPAYKDEVIAFIGASYFRALGANLNYGASARGVAIDTVGGSGEEFPRFTAFWFERPSPESRSLRFYALLDGPRVTGAYAFTVNPGPNTLVDIRARLLLRSPVSTLGIAPITSMFLTGENQPTASDFRPEVHDSDGLQIAAANGEWLWRPLTHPRRAFVTSFALHSPRGFGLLQRDRAFSSYEDLEAHYHRRPSVWVEPVGDWGDGRVELLQFGIPDETHDNVVAYWVPDRTPSPHTPMDLSWRVHWAGDQVPGAPAARVLQTRAGHGYVRPGTPAGQRQLHIDFAPLALPAGAKPEEVEAVASSNDNVHGLKTNAYPNPERGGWRVTLDYERIDASRPVELRLFLRRGSETLSETWSYAVAPE